MGRAMPPATHLQIRVLVVEDNQAFLDVVCSLLSQNPGLQVIALARDGVDAVEQARALQPELIILDIGLPKLNGILAAYQILAFLPEAKIVFLTQESSSDVIHEAMSLGACAYVLKLHAAKDLPKAVETIMADRMFGNALPSWVSHSA